MLVWRKQTPCKACCVRHAHLAVNADNRAETAKGLWHTHAL
jgi:hypothetical protein